jgi:hypothetical protein
MSPDRAPDSPPTPEPKLPSPFAPIKKVAAGAAIIVSIVWKALRRRR